MPATKLPALVTITLGCAVDLSIIACRKVSYSVTHYALSNNRQGKRSSGLEHLIHVDQENKVPSNACKLFWLRQACIQPFSPSASKMALATLSGPTRTPIRFPPPGSNLSTASLSMTKSRTVSVYTTSRFKHGKPSHTGISQQAMLPTSNTWARSTVESESPRPEFPQLTHPSAPPTTSSSCQR